MTNRESLIDKSFFPDSLKIDIDKVFPMVVVATMSSGKSTMINALLGKEFLPNRNAACTARAISILDDDRPTKETIYISNVSGQTKTYTKDIEKVLAEANENENVSGVLLRAHVNGVLNTDKALLIIDTPGPNNSRNEGHEQVLESVLKKIKGGLLLYILNASNMATNDDKHLLKEVHDLIKDNPDIQILFAVNKIDVIDEEYESIEDCMNIAKEYLENNGFDNPNIIPVSAMAAVVLKKALNGDELTRIEYSAFRSLYELYMPSRMNLKKYAVIANQQSQFSTVNIRGDDYKIGDLNQALENTGIKLLEDHIQKAQILSSSRLQNKIKVNNIKGGK